MDILVYLIIAFCVAVLVAILASRGRQMELQNWNKKNKKKFKNSRDLKAHLHLREMSRILEQNKSREEERQKEEAKEKREEEEKKRLEKEHQKEEGVSASEPGGGSLTGKIARLKKLYKNGTLTKAEFEKAKDKLLK